MKIRTKLTALLLTLALLLVPAQALTAPQLGELLEEYYVDILPDRVLEQTTVEAMLAALGDPYTEYFSAADYAAFMNSMKDSVIFGIGVVMQLTDKGVLITDVLPNLGAEKAGIRGGDLLTAVDGQEVDADTPLYTVSEWVSGEEGSTVRVRVLRDGESYTYTVTRMRVVIPATTTNLLDGHIGYINCTTFGPETLAHFEEGVRANDRAADRWIVDLRGNSGGDVDAAVRAAGTFVGSGNLTYLRDKEGKYGAYPSEEDRLTMDPVLVLTSAHTASAAELFASIIRDEKAGLVVGERTYGKGIAQTMLDGDVESAYFPNGDALKVTAYRFFSPAGAATDKVGIIPHLLVEPEQAEAVALLLAGAKPEGNTKGTLRVNLRWRWYVNLEQAMTADYQAGFAALLEALPPDATLWLGTGSGDSWKQVTAKEVAAQYALTNFAARRFSDTADSVYTEEIDNLVTYGLLEGDGTGRFQPTTTLTRAQLCALLAQSLRYTTTAAGTFADVSPDVWYASAVEALYGTGVIMGYSDGLFHPEEPVDHQQLMVILARVARRLSMRFYNETPEDFEAMMSHEALRGYATWAREDIWLLDGSQTNPIGGGVSVLWAGLGDIDPAAPATRGEAACLLHNILRLGGILPNG